jgi:ABC-type branched-subunit amino acid transport system substrate-binding protein
MRLAMLRSAAVAALGLVAAACGGVGAGQGTSGTAAGGASGPVWTLGAMNDLTGAGSNGGEAQQTGLNYFVDVTNRAGGVAGHRLRVQYCDTQSTPTGGAACARQLSAVDSHVVLLGGALPSTQGAIPQLAGVIGVSVLPVLFPKAGSSVFQVSSEERAVVAPMLAAVKASHLTTIGTLYTTDASGTAQLSAVQQGAGGGGLKVVAQAMSPGASDVTTQLLQLRSAGAQVIFLASIGAATTTGLTSYHTLAMDLPVVLGAQAVTDSFLKALPFPVPKKLYGISTLAVGTQGLTAAEQAAWKTFRADFRAQVHQPVDTQHASAYYSGCTAAAALKGTGGGAAADMATYLSTSAVSCLGAEMRFNLPGLNVVNDQPTALTQAGPTAADGWGAVRTPM